MMNFNISFKINGKPVSFQVDPHQSLPDLLRTHGYSSVKEGCGVGECGACTVLVDDMVIDSCLYLALWADGKSLRTTEGEAKDGRLSLVQEASLDRGAVQCGFCTPGLIMTSTAFVEKHKDRKDVSRHEIRRAHAKNLCRCKATRGSSWLLSSVSPTGKRAINNCLTMLCDHNDDVMYQQQIYLRALPSSEGSDRL